MDGKARLRRHLRQRRRALSAAERGRASRELAVALRRTPGWLQARRIAMYTAADGEINPAPAARAALAAGKAIYLPVVPPRPGRLRFRHWQPGSPMRRNRFGIPEPVRCARECRARELDIVVVPLVACDHEGRRLGMGGGFYDRTFAHRRRQPRWRRPLLIGVGYAFQLTPEPLHEESWDVRLDATVLIDAGVPSPQ